MSLHSAPALADELRDVLGSSFCSRISPPGEELDSSSMCVSSVSGNSSPRVDFSELESVCDDLCVLLDEMRPYFRKSQDNHGGAEADATDSEFSLPSKNSPLADRVRCSLISARVALSVLSSRFIDQQREVLRMREELISSHSRTVEVVESFCSC